LDELDSAILNLAEQRYICRERLEFSPPVRIFHIAHHIVIYQVNDNELLIIRVLHESMNVDAWLDELE
jgi:toxin ParE1/3/4